MHSIKTHIFLFLLIVHGLHATAAPLHNNPQACNDAVRTSTIFEQVIEQVRRRVQRLFHGSDTATDRLVARAPRYLLADDIRSHASVPGALDFDLTLAVRPGRFLRTSTLRSRELPYSTSPRPPSNSHPVLYENFATIPRVAVRRETNTLLVSDVRSGTTGLVRVAELQDGRPVAIKAETSQHTEEDILTEARSAQILSDLGIGPRFHGIYHDHNGRWNIVMDIVPGDFARPHNVTLTTFMDLEAAIDRLTQAGIASPHEDFQAYTTPEGHLMIIDPADLSERMHQPPDDYWSYNRERISMLVNWSQQDRVGVAYLEWLRAHKPDTWHAVLVELHHYPHPTQIHPALHRYMQQHR